VTRAAQLARGAATAAVAVSLAGFSHGIAGREAPGGVGLVLALLVALAASTAFLGRRTTTLGTVLAVVVSQGAFHLLFGVGAGANAAGGAFNMVTTGIGHHEVVTVVEAAGAATPHVGHSDAAMLVGHAVAAALTVVYLLALERAAWQVAGAAVRRLVQRLLGVGLPLPTPVRSAPVVAPASIDALRSRLLVAAMGSRGPPSMLRSS
jgi:hypothetical protein